MSISVISHQDIENVLKKTSTIPSTTNESFYDIFGTSGCRLNCKAFQTYELSSRELGESPSGESKGARRQARTALKKERSSVEHWFTARDTTDSAAEGCGSCTIIDQLIQIFFPERGSQPPGGYEYSLTSHFELRRRAVLGHQSLQSVQLFRPLSPGVHVPRFFKSDFLCGRDMSIVRLRGWLDQCLHSHKSCSKQDSEQNDNTRPSRLLHLANLTRGSANGIRLIETESRHYAYACLSHRWDGIVHQLKTTTANYNDARDFIDLETLPANFRDAIWIARKLQIDYIWIDSICIIQDGDGGKDLNRELAKMGHIYRGSFLTIAAVSSATADGGCFRSDIEKDMCLQILDHSLRPIIIGARILDRQGRPNTLENFQLHYPLLSRGWVLQERLLSSRLVQCNYGELAFECLESDHCECGSNIAPHGASAQQVLAMPASYRSQLHSQSQPDTTVLLSTWRTIISRYMQHELTQPMDVLPAIGGIAQAMSVSLGYTYIAGMWKETLAEDLLWYVMQRHKSRRPRARPEGSSAPTWSWASVSMGQTLGHMRLNGSGHTLLRNRLLLRQAIEDIHCIPLVKHVPFGRLNIPHLKMKTMLYPWYLRWYCIYSEGIIQRHNRGKTDLYVGDPNRELKVDLAQGSNRASKRSSACVAPISPLPVGGANVQVMFDDCPSLDNRKIGITRETFGNCIAHPPVQCGLGRVYLLHASHQSDESWSTDVFLILKKITGTADKANCYSRLGLMRMSGMGLDWNEIISSKIVPYEETFYIF